MQAVWNGVVLADSEDTVVVEENHYFPAAALNMDYFESSGNHSICPWKGVASYYDIVLDGERNKAAAWYYPPSISARAESQGTCGVLERR